MNLKIDTSWMELYAEQMDFIEEEMHCENLLFEFAGIDPRKEWLKLRRSKAAKLGWRRRRAAKNR